MLKETARISLRVFLYFSDTTRLIRVSGLASYQDLFRSGVCVCVVGVRPFCGMDVGGGGGRIGESRN